MNNLEKLSSNLKSHEALLIISSANRKHLTGFTSSAGYLVIGSNGSAFFTDSRYIEAASEKITVCPTHLLRDFKEDVSEFIFQHGYRKIHIEAEKVTVSQLKFLEKNLKLCKIVSDGNLDKSIAKLREVKTEEEISKIRTAQKIAEKAFDDILSFIKEGVSELEIAARLENIMRMNGSEGFAFDTIAITGKNTSKPHGVPTDNKVKKGDFITMDYGAVFDSYRSDMTRTVAVGEVSSKQAEIYDTVLKAQENSLSCLKSGVKCSDADKAARDIIRNAGYGELFGHSTGHGVGIDIHETPNLAPKSKAILEAGNVVTVEPGIYLPGEFGVRIEDFVVITDTGYINLTSAPKNLIVL
ncbi:MAG: aminopeptidase P family protein [Clostridia bacterium]|nr:aminopeptidase P family protein [Clostridia bacterium]